MATLESLDHLGTWCEGMGRDKAQVLADPFATMVLERATELVTSAAGIPVPAWETDPTLVPSRARTICLLVAARTYTNPRSIITEGTGPLNESILAKMAAAMELTQDEKDELEAMKTETGSFGGLWVIRPIDDTPRMPTVYLPDNLGSDWEIPYGETSQTGAFGD
jgi:hypothetical protein